jgi:hypothetical protein
LVSAAGEKLAVVVTTDDLRREPNAGRREHFEKSLEAVPDVAPPENDRVPLAPETVVSRHPRRCSIN